MGFIDWFMGNAAVWLLIFLIIVDIVILAAILWLMYQEWRER